MTVDTERGARRALLERLVHHAALFPPASLDMAGALAADRRARGGAEAWMLGRFVCPASRLEELAAEGGGAAPPLTVVLDGDLDAALLRHVEAGTGFPMHGFLNLLAACCLAHVHGAGADDLAAVLALEDPAAIGLDDGGLAVAGRHTGAAAMAEVRRAFFHGYGSCSFAEPVEDLRALGLLPG
jgi:hypothetical protein